MEGPFNYFGQMPALDLLGNYARGAEAAAAPELLRQQTQGNAVKLQQAALKIQKDAEYQRDMMAVMSNPSPEAYRQLMLAHPEEHEAIKSGWEAYSETEKKRNVEAATNVYGAIRSGNPELALAKLKQRKAALENGKEDTTETDALISLIESGNPENIQKAAGLAGYVLANAYGPEKGGDIIKQLDDLTVVDGNLVDRNGKALFSAAKIVPVQAGGSVYEYRAAGDGGYVGGAAPSTSEAPAATPASPGGARFALSGGNNPGAIKDGPWARSQPGYKGASGAFATFESPQAGIAAQETLLRKYLSSGAQTVNQIVNRYLGKGDGENSQASRANYKTYVAQRLGVNPGDGITSGRISELAKAMREFETGKRAGGGGDKGVVRVGSVDQAMKLKPGTVFIDPNGVRRVR